MADCDRSKLLGHGHSRRTDYRYKEKKKTGREQILRLRDIDLLAKENTESMIML